MKEFTENKNEIVEKEESDEIAANIKVNILLILRRKELLVM